MAYLQPTRASANATAFPDYSSSDFVTGLEMVHTSTTTFTINSGAAKAYNTNYVISMPPINPNTALTVEIDTTTVGAFGCYPVLPAVAAPTNDTSFGVYILGNSSGTTGGSLTPSTRISPTIIVATGDDFLLPGYDTWRRIGTVWFSAGTNNLIYTSVTGSGNIRNYSLNNAIVLTNVETQTFAAVNLSAGDFPCSPHLTSSVDLGYFFDPNTAASLLQLTPSISPTVTSPIINFKYQTASVGTDSVFSMIPGVTSSSVSFYYKNTDAADTLILSLIGWQESLSLSAI